MFKGFLKKSKRFFLLLHFEFETGTAVGNDHLTICLYDPPKKRQHSHEPPWHFWTLLSREVPCKHVLQGKKQALVFHSESALWRIHQFFEKNTTHHLMIKSQGCKEWEQRKRYELRPYEGCFWNVWVGAQVDVPALGAEHWVFWDQGLGEDLSGTLGSRGPSQAGERSGVWNTGLVKKQSGTCEITIGYSQIDLVLDAWGRGFSMSLACRDFNGVSDLKFSSGQVSLAKNSADISVSLKAGALTPTRLWVKT